MAEDSIWYTGFNAEEVLEWANERGEKSLTYFEGELTLFLPDHRLTLSRGDILEYSDVSALDGGKMIKVRKRNFLWYNDYE